MDKECAKCRETKPASDFYRNKKSKDGLQSRCKSCQNKNKGPSKFLFPPARPCKRCGSTHTKATSTQGKVQYRKCLVAICRHRYTVIGTALKTRKENSNGQDQQDQ